MRIHAEKVQPGSAAIRNEGESAITIPPWPAKRAPFPITEAGFGSADEDTGWFP